jgi:hypothetical protein
MTTKDTIDSKMNNHYVESAFNGYFVAVAYEDVHNSAGFTAMADSFLKRIVIAGDVEGITSLFAHSPSINEANALLRNRNLPQLDAKTLAKLLPAMRALIAHKIGIIEAELHLNISACRKAMEQVLHSELA